MTFVPPCRRPENDPDDWFIERDGKQYRDEELVSDEELEDVPWEERAKVRAELEAERVKENLTKRRHAKDKCWTECIAAQRLGVCLEMGMRPEGLPYGTWGGYYSEERIKIDRERQRRQR